MSLSHNDIAGGFETCKSKCPDLNYGNCGVTKIEKVSEENAHLQERTFGQDIVLIWQNF